jgi:acetoin utilization deacetylase AcuC-like enzyme
MATGIFFYYQQGERLKGFPEALEGILERDNVFFYDALYPLKPESSFDLTPISLETIQKVHSPEMVGRVKVTGGYEGALYSAAGTVSAGIRVCSGELTNAFIFTGYGDHHAGSNFFGGGCYFNGAAIAIHELREKFGVKRCAIVDTDTHHGDGTWELFQYDPDIRYICLCSGPFQERNGNVNIHVPTQIDDHGYLALARDALEKWLKGFHPEIIFWNWGYDGTTGEYGDIGLTPGLHLQMARGIKELAGEICNGRLVVVLCGGSRRVLASFLIPRVLEILASE